MKSTQKNHTRLRVMLLQNPEYTANNQVLVPAQMHFVPSNKHPDGRYKKVSQHGEFASPLNVNLAREHLPASANMNVFVHLGTNFGW